MPPVVDAAFRKNPPDEPEKEEKHAAMAAAPATLKSRTPTEPTITLAYRSIQPVPRISCLPEAHLEVLGVAVDKAGPGSERADRRPHQLSLKKREELVVDGVNNVESFDDAEIVLETTLGVLIVRGEGLKVKELNIETGSMAVTGRIEALEYAGETFGEKGRGFLGRLLR